MIAVSMTVGACSSGATEMPAADPPASRDPCAAVACAVGQHCTAPDDRPACVADSASIDHRAQPPDPVGTTPFSDRPCERDDQCNTGERCFAPDFVPGHGTVQKHDCGSDAQCTNGAICVDGICGARCTSDATCGPNMECRNDGHCAQLRCDNPRAERCPLNHICGRSGACERTTCTTASQCDAGACWKGQCFARGGACMAAAFCCPP